MTKLFIPSKKYTNTLLYFLNFHGIRNISAFLTKPRPNTFTKYALIR